MAVLASFIECRHGQLFIILNNSSYHFMDTATVVFLGQGYLTLYPFKVWRENHTLGTKFPTVYPEIENPQTKLLLLKNNCRDFLSTKQKDGPY
jgi:hypothetical protein